MIKQIEIRAMIAPATILYPSMRLPAFSLTICQLFPSIKPILIQIRFHTAALITERSNTFNMFSLVMPDTSDMTDLTPGRNLFARTTK